MATAFTFIPSGAKTQKKEIMPYPICSVVAGFKMLIRILNPLRSRIWDMALFLFSSVFSSINLMSYIIIKGCDSCFICSDSYYIFYIIKEDLTIAVLAGVKCFLCGFYN